MEMVKLPRLVIGAAGSGSGKTTVTCAILKALKDRGINVGACKCGPDYIDPMFHERAIGVSSRNIDGFFCGDKLVQRLAERAGDCDVLICEGVMGYYDGISMGDFTAGTYDIASKTKTPAVLVVSGKGMALTAAALVKGIADFRRDSNIKGVILNNVSPAVAERLSPVILQNTGIPVVGCLPNLPHCAFDSRHLGLVTPDAAVTEKLNILGKAAEQYIDIDSILKIADEAEPLPYNTSGEMCKPADLKIAVAMDEAFCFYYKDNIDLLKKMGCDILYFSPIRDKAVPKAKGILLGGGYPELYAEELSKNREMLTDIKNKLLGGMPCLAECGGFMYLHNNMQDKNGVSHKMAGVVDGDAVYKGRLVRFGYITLSAQAESCLLKKGEKIRAHEFHYWDSTNNGCCFKADKPAGGKGWVCMHSIENTLCGFPHIYYPSNPHFARGFVEKCRQYKL